MYEYDRSSIGAVYEYDIVVYQYLGSYKGVVQEEHAKNKIAGRIIHCLLVMPRPW